MPAFTADYFGARNLGTIYGLLLIGATAGAFGPLLIATFGRPPIRTRASYT